MISEMFEHFKRDFGLYWNFPTRLKLLRLTNQKESLRIIHEEFQKSIPYFLIDPFTENIYKSSNVRGQHIYPLPSPYILISNNDLDLDTVFPLPENLYPVRLEILLYVIPHFDCFASSSTRLHDNFERFDTLK